MFRLLHYSFIIYFNMLKQKLFFNAVVLMIALLTLQCGTLVQRIQTNKIVDLSGRWNDTDARLVAEEIVQDFMQSPFRTNYTNTHVKLPVVIVGNILNKSHEHIEAETFIKSIECELIKMQSVRI